MWDYFAQSLSWTIFVLTVFSTLLSCAIRDIEMRQASNIYIYMFDPKCEQATRQKPKFIVWISFRKGARLFFITIIFADGIFGKIHKLYCLCLHLTQSLPSIPLARSLACVHLLIHTQENFQVSRNNGWLLRENGRLKSILRIKFETKTHIHIHIHTFCLKHWLEWRRCNTYTQTHKTDGTYLHVAS